MSDQHATDCRTADGTTVGLIDAIMTAARCLVERDWTSPAAAAAIRDLRQDADVLKLLGLERVEPTPRPVLPPVAGIPTIPCPRCQAPTGCFDHSGLTCWECEIFFSSEAGDDVAAALANTDPAIQAWIVQITAAGWDHTTGKVAQRDQVETIDGPIPADHPALGRIVWECPDCLWCNDRATDVAEARRQIHQARLGRPSANPGCKCPNLRRKP